MNAPRESTEVEVFVGAGSLSTTAARLRNVGVSLRAAGGQVSVCGYELAAGICQEVHIRLFEGIEKPVVFCPNILVLSLLRF